MARAKACEDHEDNTAGCAECDALRLLAEAAPRPGAPNLGMSDADVESTDFDYTTRSKEDWVSSGPLGENGHGKGRCFSTWVAAEAWAREFYGERYKGRKPEEPNSGGRWAFIIKGPRG